MAFAHARLCKGSRFTMLQGLPRDWGSRCCCDFWERVVGGDEALPEAGAKRAVVDGAADLEQPVGAAPRRDQRICCDLFMRRLTRKLAVPSVNAVPTRSPARCRSP